MRKLTTEEKIAVLELTKKKLGRGGKNWIKGIWFGRQRFIDRHGQPSAQEEIGAQWISEGQVATCFCLEGAIDIAAYELGLKTRPEIGAAATNAVSVRDYLVTRDWDSANHFNDAKDTEWKDVLGVINGRLKQLRKELNP